MEKFQEIVEEAFKDAPLAIQDQIIFAASKYSTLQPLKATKPRKNSQSTIKQPAKVALSFIYLSAKNATYNTLGSQKPA